VPNPALDQVRRLSAAPAPSSFFLALLPAVLRLDTGASRALNRVRRLVLNPLSTELGTECVAWCLPSSSPGKTAPGSLPALLELDTEFFYLH
jgi:hypothetical protein